jgi:hypothetical protein
MKYSNGQEPKLLDKVQGGPLIGTCRVACIHDTFLSLRNVLTGEYFEHDHVEEIDLLKRFERKFYYLFVGNTFDELDKKSVRFIVESPHPWTADNRCIGRVIARNAQAPRKIYEEAAQEWANPSKDIAAGLPLAFIPCPRKHILAMEDSGISMEEREEIIAMGF